MDTEHHIAAGRDARVFACAFFLEGKFFCFDGQAAAIGHCVPGIEDQVQQHLDEVGGIDSDPSYLYSGRNRYGYFLIDELPD